jgi:tetratricopeptide (TPR) repeat protein
MPSAEAVMSHAKELRRQGDEGAAEASYGEAADLAGSEGQEQLRAHALRHVAELAAQRGAGERALEAAEEALAIYQADPGASPLDIANAHRIRALAFGSLGRAEESAEDWSAARELYEELGIHAGVAECDRRLARL